MRECARAVVIRDGKLLIMKRVKPTESYYALLGGGIEAGETPDQAAIREVAEEASIVIANPTLIFIEEPHQKFGRQYIYLCDYVSGEPMLAEDSVESTDNILGSNNYEPMWIDLDMVKDLPFRSPMLQKALVYALQNGFPGSPKHLTSRA